MVGLILPVLFLTAFVETSIGKQSKDSHTIKIQGLIIYTVKHRTSESMKELEELRELGTGMKRMYEYFLFKTCM